jgi:hypothetical protein
VNVEPEGSDAAVSIARVTISARVYLFLSGVLDNFSIALFFFPFSVIVHALSSVWCRFLAEE